MKHLQALLVFLRLAASPRYRQRWHRTIDRVDADLDAVAASERQIEVMENEGKPRVRVL